MLLDVDVKGALAVKERFGDGVLTLFVAPPSLDELERRPVSYTHLTLPTKSIV